MVKRPPAGKIGKKVIEKSHEVSAEHFEKLFDLYGEKILNYIHNYIREDVETSKDLMQETFISIYNGIKGLKDADKFENWIYTIASNKCRDHLRKRKYLPVVNSELLNEIEDSPRENRVNSSDDRLDMEMINEIVRLMPADLREVFTLKKYENKKFEDIARITDCSLRTVKYRMKKAINIFSRELQKRGFNFES